MVGGSYETKIKQKRHQKSFVNPHTRHNFTYQSPLCKTQTKLGEACEQLHSDKVKKPMQLRHYGQCLIGISWIHYKQVEYLHNDCNEAFSKARLVLVRKRKVDLDPSKDRGRDITLPEHKQNGGNDLQIEERQLLDFDLDENINLSQLYLDNDNISEVGSLLGTDSHSGANRSIHDHQALDHEITMQQNELNSTSPNRSIRDRRSSFGGISSLLMGDMDIEIKFDDDDDDDADGLDESQARRANIDDLANLTDDESVERGRGGINHTMMMNADDANISEGGILADNVSLNEAGSHISSFAKEKEHRIEDAVSAHSGSIADGIDVNNMDIDEQSVHSVHVQFNLDDQSMNGSVATTALMNIESSKGEQVTPPSSPNAAAAKSVSKNKIKKKSQQRKKRKKKRFAADKKIEFDRDELIATNIENAEFLHPAGRDSLHIWREFPLASLGFDELMQQPLSKDLFGKFPANICKHFALCNSKTAVALKQQQQQQNVVDIIGESEVEKGRDYGSDQAVNEHDGDDEDNDERMDDLALPMNDLSMSMNQLKEVNEAQIALDADDDNASTLDSVCNDAVPAPRDPLFDDDDVQPLEDNLSVHADEDGDVETTDNHLSFDTNDENILTQMDDGSQTESIVNDNGIKPRDWSRRARKTFAFFKRKEGSEFSFDKLMESQTKRETVVGVFYELLVFKNSGLVDLKQKEPYGDITITKTKNFYRHAMRSQRLSQRISGIHEH